MIAKRCPDSRIPDGHLVSIVLPVFNAERFLREAINSVLAQSHYNLELIIVDDGSTDLSGEMCDEFARRDDRVAVIHQRNRGISAARNEGLNHAAGEWIGFCDHDDFMWPDFIRDALYLGEINEADFVKMSVEYILIDEDNSRQEIPGYTLPDTVLGTRDLGSAYKELRNSGGLTFVWNTLVRRELLSSNQIRFDERMKVGGEDRDFNFQLLETAARFVTCSLPGYTHYRRRVHSTVERFDASKGGTSWLLWDRESSVGAGVGVPTNVKAEIACEYLSGMVAHRIDPRSGATSRGLRDELEDARGKLVSELGVREWIGVLARKPVYAIVALAVVLRAYPAVRRLGYFRGVRGR